MIKAVVFDLDDTLISEKEYIKSGYKHIAGILSGKYEINKEKVYEDLISLFKEEPNKVFNRLFEKYYIDYFREDIISLVNEYRSHLPDIAFYDDVIPCINHLKFKEIKTGIITDGFAKAQMQKLKVINAYKYFDEIILTDELGRDCWKPNPKAFEIMKERLNVEFNEMIYIGDNPEKDFYISKIYPIKTVRILRLGSIYSNVLYLKGIREKCSINKLTNLKI